MNNPSQSPSTEKMPRHIRIGLLLDVYGALLTDRQREFVQLHYDEDQSFGEIAAVKGVSRQAVHDAVKHAEQSLEQYESKLRLLERGWPGILARIEESPLPRDGDSGEPALTGSEEWVVEALDKEALTGPILDGTNDPAASPTDASSSRVLAQVEEGLDQLQRRILRSGGIIYDADGLLSDINHLLDRVREAKGPRAPEQGGPRNV